MKLFLLSLILFLQIPVMAKTRYGLGLMLGAPTGVSGKLLKPGHHPIDAGVSFGNEFELFSTYLFPQKKRLNLDNLRLRWYWGFGGKLKNIHDDIYVGPRASAGINHYFKKHSLEAFAETAFNLFIVPKSKGDLDLIIGARYYF